MSEDVSAFVRMSVTVNLFAALLFGIVVIAAVSLQWLNTFETNFVTAVNVAGKSSGAELKNISRISAAIAYKFIVTREGEIDELKITYKDGTVTADYKTLLNNADKFVKLSYVDSAQGMIKVTVQEVD